MHISFLLFVRTCRRLSTKASVPSNQQSENRRRIYSLVSHLVYSLAASCRMATRSLRPFRGPCDRDNQGRPALSFVAERRGPFPRVCGPLPRGGRNGVGGADRSQQPRGTPSIRSCPRETRCAPHSGPRDGCPFADRSSTYAGLRFRSRQSTSLGRTLCNSSALARLRPILEE
jgi:hypothetical protein